MSYADNIFLRLAHVECFSRAYNTGYQFCSVLLSIQGLQDQCPPEAAQISHMTTRSSNWNVSDEFKITGANPK